MLTSSEFAMGGGAGVGVFCTKGFRTAMMSPKPGRSCGCRQQDAMRFFRAGCMSSVKGSLALAHPTAPTTCTVRSSLLPSYSVHCSLHLGMLPLLAMHSSQHALRSRRQTALIAGVTSKASFAF